MRKILLAILALIPCIAFSQAIGEKSYLKSISIGGEGMICRKARNSIGNLVCGDKLATVPAGTVVLGQYGGNGYWLTTDITPEGVYSGMREVKQKFVEPSRILGKQFSHEFYETEYPSLGDRPWLTRVIQISEKQDLPDNKGNVVVTITDIKNPGQDNASKQSSLCYGTLEPHRIVLTSYSLSGDTPVQLEEPLSIYVNGSDSDYLDDEIYGIYYNSIHYEYYKY